MSASRLAGFFWVVLVLALRASAQAGTSQTGAIEPVVWLQEYLQIDTSNPPGNERAGAEFLGAILEREGLPPRLLTSPDGRTSLYARWVSPTSQGRAIALVHHIDVVPAGEGWVAEPFSGRPYRGSLWGRGAIDTKSLGIAYLAALAYGLRQGIDLQVDVIYLAVADEELGGGQGAGWLVEEHAALFTGLEGVLNEGGSNRVFEDRVLWWGVEVTQKRPLWLRVTAAGRGGHGSGFNPGSATHKLVRALARLIDRPLRFRVSDATRNFLGALGKIEGGGSRAFAESLDEIIREDGPTRPLPPGMPVYFLDTVQVTEFDNGDRGPNVVAAEASALIDIRILPDTNAEAFLAGVRETLGPEIEVEVLLTAPPAPASPMDSRLFQVVEQVLSVRAPVVPLFISGTTDSRYFRQRGIPAYGLQPFVLNPLDTRGIHAANEHIPVAPFQRAIEVIRRILMTYGKN